MQENTHNPQPRIISVGALEGDCFDITFESGHTVLLELGNRVEELPFALLIARKQFDKPKTDGRCIYWEDGTAFSVGEVLAMLTAKEEGKQTEKKEEKE